MKRLIVALVVIAASLGIAGPAEAAPRAPACTPLTCVAHAYVTEEVVTSPGLAPLSFGGCVFTSLGRLIDRRLYLTNVFGGTLVSYTQWQGWCSNSTHTKITYGHYEFDWYVSSFAVGWSPQGWSSGPHTSGGVGYTWMHGDSVYAFTFCAGPVCAWHYAHATQDGYAGLGWHNSGWWT